MVKDNVYINNYVNVTGNSHMVSYFDPYEKQIFSKLTRRPDVTIRDDFVKTFPHPTYAMHRTLSISTAARCTMCRQEEGVVVEGIVRCFGQGLTPASSGIKKWNN